MWRKGQRSLYLTGLGHSLLVGCLCLETDTKGWHLHACSRGVILVDHEQLWDLQKAVQARQVPHTGDWAPATKRLEASLTTAPVTWALSTDSRGWHRLAKWVVTWAETPANLLIYR